jgi:hypothetical protein
MPKIPSAQELIERNKKMSKLIRDYRKEVGPRKSVTSDLISALSDNVQNSSSLNGVTTPK